MSQVGAYQTLKQIEDLFQERFVDRGLPLPKLLVATRGIIPFDPTTGTALDCMGPFDHEPDVCIVVRLYRRESKWLVLDQEVHQGNVDETGAALPFPPAAKPTNRLPVYDLYYMAPHSGSDTTTSSSST